MSSEGGDAKRHLDLQGEYDIVIVGGGSHGGALAWQASIRGYRVLLLEKQDFVSATSSNSLKIIHGGVRYLQRLDIQRLRLSVSERKRLLTIAPHLVAPLKCVIPTYQKLSKNKWIVGAAFKLYDVLSLDRNSGMPLCRKIPNTHTVPKRELKALFPNVESGRFTGGAIWYDAMVRDPERLTLSYLFSAQQHGAKIMNYTGVTELLIESNGVVGLVANDVLSQKKIEIKCDLVVDATGPWSFFKKYTNRSVRDWHYTKAVNIIVCKRLVDNAIGLTVPASSNAVSRMLFMVPSEGFTAIGTWYFQCKGGAVGENKVSHEEMTLILQDLNSVLSDISVCVGDVSRIQVGLLPVKNGVQVEGDPELIGDSEIGYASEYGGPDGLLYVQGTKLTTALSSSIRCLNLIDSTKKRRNSTIIASDKLFDWQTTEKYDEFLSKCTLKYSHLWPEYIVCEIIRRFGTNIAEIAAIAEGNRKLQGIVPGSTCIPTAMVEYVIENEGVFSLSDLLLRRINVGAYAVPAMAVVEYCADQMADHLGWSNAVRSENISDLLETYLLWTKEK